MTSYLHLTHPKNPSHNLLIAEGETARDHGYFKKDGWKSVPLERPFDERFETVDEHGKITSDPVAKAAMDHHAKIATMDNHELVAHFEERISALEDKLVRLMKKGI